VAVTSSAKQRVARAALVASIAAGLIWSIANRERFDVESLTGRIQAFGLLAPLAFCAVRVVGAVIMVPGSVMAIAAGILFGVFWGALYNLVASTAGAVLAFAIARYLFPDLIRRYVAGRARLRRLVDGVEQEGWRFVAFVRLVPLFPYNVLNYALGLTRIRLSHFALASLICMVPGDIAYVYLGFAAREAMASNERAVHAGLIALGLLATLAFIPLLVRRYRQSRAISPSDDSR